MKIKVKDVATINKRNFDFDGISQINYLDTSNITRNIVNTFQSLKIDDDIIPSRARRAVEQNTIIYSTVRPRLEHYGILTDIPVNCVVSTGFVTIDADVTKIDPYYLYLQLTLPDKTKKLAQIADTSVSSYPSINYRDIADLELEIEKDLNKQKEISNKIKQLHNKVVNNMQIIEELELKLNTIFDYWFLQYEFPNEYNKPYKSSNGKMIYNNKLEVEIPYGWRIRKIKSIINELEKSNIPVGEAIDGTGVIPFFTSGLNIKNINEYLVDGFNLFLATGGTSNINIHYGKASYSTDTWCVNFGEYTSIMYFYFKAMQDQFDTLFFHGTGLKHLQKPIFLKTNIILPGEFILKKFNNISLNIFKKIAILKEEIIEANKLAEFLMPLLLRGKVKMNYD